MAKKRSEWDVIECAAKEAGRVYICIDYYPTDDDFQVHFGEMEMDAEGRSHFVAKGGKLAKTLRYAMCEAARRFFIGHQREMQVIEDVFKRDRERVAAGKYE